MKSVPCKIVCFTDYFVKNFGTVLEIANLKPVEKCKTFMNKKTDRFYSL